MTDARGVGVVTLRWLILSEWKAFPVRVVLAVLAIAMGVALGFAVHLINASALSEFDHAVRTVNGDADLQVHSTSALGFAESLYPTLAHVKGVAQASPVVELSAQASAKAPLTVVGLDVLRAATVTPRLLGRRGDGRHAPDDLFGDRDVFLSAAALRASHRRVGDSIKLTAAGRVFTFSVAGDLPGVDADQSLAVMDVAAAQWRFAQLGRLQRVDLRLDAGADRTQALAAVAAVLPVGAEIVSRQSQEASSNELSRAYRINLDMLALMALLTGGFLVYSAQALSVARRRPQFALIRVLGLERRALLAQVFVEAAAVGGLGAIAGLALGMGLAYGALHLLGSDLGGGYFMGALPHLTLAPGAAVGFGGLGLAASFIGSLLPAREAARSQPAVALKNLGDAIDPRNSPRALPALLLLVAGAAAALAPPLWGLPILGYLAIALMLAGGVMAMPWITRLLLSPLRRWVSAAPAVRLAIERLWGAPSQASIALSGIVASTSLMIAMAVMVASFRGSVQDWLYQILPADLYLSLDAGASGAGFDAAVQTRMRQVPGVAWIDFLKITSLSLAPGKPPVALLARAVDGPAGELPLLGRSLPVPPHRIPVWVSEPAAGIYGYRPGDDIALPIPGLTAPVFVAGIWRDYGRQQGAIVMDGATYARLTGDTLCTVASVALKPGASDEAVVRAMRALLPPAWRDHVDVSRPREIRAKGLAAFDRSFAITYLLELIPILVGLIGVAATLSAQTLARTKEFGMLRHLGVMRRQIVAMLVTEGALLGVIGSVAGIGLGLAMSQVLIHVVNPQSFHWTMDTRIPWWLLGSVLALLMLAAAGTARLAGARALSSDAVRAVREDW